MIRLSTRDDRAGQAVEYFVLGAQRCWNLWFSGLGQWILSRCWIPIGTGMGGSFELYIYASTQASASASHLG